MPGRQVGKIFWSYYAVLVVAKSMWCHYWNIDFGIVHKASTPQHIYICTPKPHTCVELIYWRIYINSTMLMKTGEYGMSTINRSFLELRKLSFFLCFSFFWSNCFETVVRKLKAAWVQERKLEGKTVCANVILRQFVQNNDMNIAILFRNLFFFTCSKIAPSAPFFFSAASIAISLSEAWRQNPCSLPNFSTVVICDCLQHSRSITPSTFRSTTVISFSILLYSWIIPVSS